MSSSGNAAATQSPVTNNDHSALISIAVWFLMTTFVSAVLIRFVIRLIIARSLNRDDWTSFASMVVGIAQAAAVAVGIKSGLGRQERLLSPNQIADAEQAQYAADIFYLLALALAKASMFLLLQRLAGSRSHKRLALCMAVLSGAWGMVGILVLAVRCRSRLPWTAISASQCIDLRAFWIAMAPVDVGTELVIVLIPVLMMIPVQVAISKKAVIVIAFLFRVMVVIATIIRLLYVIPALPSPNFTWDMVNMEILNQIVLSVSITTACIPCLKPFLDAFDSGRMAVTVHGVSGSSHSRSYPLRELDYAKGLSYGNHKSTVRSQVDAAGDMEDMESLEATQLGSDGRKAGANGFVNLERGKKDKDENHDNHSLASSGKSDQMIIKKNVQFTVKYEDVDHEIEREVDRGSERRHLSGNGGAGLAL